MDRHGATLSQSSEKRARRPPGAAISCQRSYKGVAVAAHLRTVIPEASRQPTLSETPRADARLGRRSCGPVALASQSALANGEVAPLRLQM